MDELSLEQVPAVGGGMTGIEGAGLILALGSFAVASPVIVGIAFGAAAGLVIAECMARTRS